LEAIFDEINVSKIAIIQTPNDAVIKTLSIVMSWNTKAIELQSKN
jgi:hypothetical protein